MVIKMQKSLMLINCYKVKRLIYSNSQNSLIIYQKHITTVRHSNLFYLCTFIYKSMMSKLSFALAQPLTR